MSQSFAYQIQEKGCGIACIKTLLCLVSKNPEYRFLKEPEASKEAPSLEDLMDYGREEGMELFAFRIPKEELDSISTFPCILLEEKERKTHMVVLLNVKKGKVQLFDPAEGKKVLKIEEEKKVFNGVCLLVSSFYPNSKFKAEDPLPFRFRLIPGLSLLLSTFFFFFGTLFFGSSSPIFLPLLFFGIGLVSLIFFSVSVSLGMKYFDQAYGSKIEDGDPKKRKKKYLLFQRYKQRVFGRKYSSMASIFLSLSLTGALAFRDPMMGLTLLIGLALLPLLWIFDESYLEKEKKEVSVLEERILGSESSNKNEIQSLLKGSRTFSNRYLFRGFFLLFAAGFVSFLSLLIEHRLTFDGFIYCFFPLTFVLSQMDSLFASHKEKETNSRLDLAFRHCFVVEEKTHAHTSARKE